jgi:dTDP-D-glucose 4,6-dehydratase
MSKNHERTKKDDAPEALIPSSANILVTGGAGFIGSNFIRIKKNLGWKPKHAFADGLKATLSWYIKNANWVSSVRTGEYKTWVEKNYIGRL